MNKRHIHGRTHIWLPSCAVQGWVHQLALVQRKKKLVARKAAFLTPGKWQRVGSLSTGSLCLSSYAISQRLCNTKHVAQLPWVSGSFFKETGLEMVITIHQIHIECLPSSRHSKKWTRKHSIPTQRQAHLWEVALSIQGFRILDLFVAGHLVTVYTMLLIFPPTLRWAVELE